MSSVGPHNYEIVHVRDRTAWRRWLEENHERANGAWLVRPRRAAGGRGIDYDALVEEALCFGWVDSREQPIDDEQLMQLVTPRKAGGSWARSNKERVERLEAAGLMTEAGSQVVKAAKADGSWSRYDSAEALEIPDDLAAALAADANAARNFEAFSDAAKRTILRRLIDAKRPGTRAKRVEEVARLAAMDERAQS